MKFPTYRPRRLRRNEKLRQLIRETSLEPRNFIYPLFVGPGKDNAQPVSSMPGVAQLTVDRAVRECQDVSALGIPAVILFGIPERKDAVASEAYADDGVVQQAIRAIKDKLPELLVITDVCLCEYTDHGHCGVIKNGDVDNDSTLELLAKESVSHARAGADIVAPSDMMDGRVGAIRKMLDENGFAQTPIMVKPALAYLDVIYRVKQKFGYPLAAYNVSGEYSMIKAAGQNGWIDEARIMMEVLFAIRRAGADMILSYFAKDAARLLHGQ